MLSLDKMREKKNFSLSSSFLSSDLVSRSDARSSHQTTTNVQSGRNEVVRSMACVLQEGMETLLAIPHRFCRHRLLITKLTAGLTEEDAKNSKFVQQHRRYHLRAKEKLEAMDQF